MTEEQIKYVVNLISQDIEKDKEINYYKKQYRYFKLIREKALTFIGKCDWNDTESFEKLIDILVGSDNNLYETEDYKSRCKKAIEYIKDKGLYEEELDIFNDDINYNELDDLLNILNGSDNNE